MSEEFRPRSNSWDSLDSVVGLLVDSGVRMKENDSHRKDSDSLLCRSGISLCFGQPPRQRGEEFSSRERGCGLTGRARARARGRGDGDTPYLIKSQRHKALRETRPRGDATNQ
jgi:hypothetical protein